jgi:hypothetical protein
MAASGDQGARNSMNKLAAKAGLLCCALLCIDVPVAHAGPCSEDIAKFEAEKHESAGNPGAGLTAPQSIGAQLDRQPTPASVQRAQARLKSKFAASMARARRLDARGDRAGCMRALSAAERIYIP